jgi:glucokinase
VLALFASLYGAEAGNLALKSLATGGVFVCGGIAAHYADEIARGDFMGAFAAKGRFAPLLGNVPVAIVLDTDIGLSGSAFYAARGVAAGT